MSKSKPQSGIKKQKYEKPKIVYEGKLTTRAGSRPGGVNEHEVDPSKLFGNVD